MSHLPAFTNEPGNHTRYVVKATHSRGRFGNNPPYDNITYHTVADETSSKPWPHPGDRKKAYNYSRFVGKVVADIPFVTRHFDYHVGDDGVRYYNWDYQDETLISTLHGPFNFRPTGGEEESNSSKRANVKALNDLGGQKTQTGADLGETRQTFRMLSESSAQMAKALIAARRGQWGRIPGLLGMNKADVLSGRYPASKWLEFQYGWKPLASSIYELERATRFAHSQDQFIRGVGTSSWEDSYSFPYRDELWTVKVSGSHRRVYLAQVTVPALHNTDSIGLLNPLSIAWELVPFSFVLDWFIPVGQTIEALTAPLGLLPLGGWESSHRTYELEAHRNMSTPMDPYHSENIASGSYQEVGYSFNRTAFASFELPSFFTAPSPYRTTRALNALALIRQLHRS